MVRTSATLASYDSIQIYILSNMDLDFYVITWAGSFVSEKSGTSLFLFLRFHIKFPIFSNS